MNRTLLNVLGIVVFALHASASLAEHRHDLNSLLKGKYRFTFHQTCTYSQAGFLTDPPGGDVLGFAQTGVDYIDGVVKFDGDGTMTLTEKGVFQNHGGSNPGFFPIATYFDICAGTYQVESDLSFSYELSCTVKLLTGFNAGSTISIDGLRLTGQIDRDRDTYIASNVTGAVQTMTFSTGFVNQRICGGETTGVKLSK